MRHFVQHLLCEIAKVDLAVQCFVLLWRESSLAIYTHMYKIAQHLLHAESLVSNRCVIGCAANVVSICCIILPGFVCMFKH